MKGSGRPSGATQPAEGRARIGAHSALLILSFHEETAAILAIRLQQELSAQHCSYLTVKQKRLSGRSNE